MPAAARRGRDRHAAELQHRAVGEQPAGADDGAVVVDRDEVQRLAVAPVELLLERDALLVDEHGGAQRDRRGDLVRAGRAADRRRVTRRPPCVPARSGRCRPRGPAVDVYGPWWVKTLRPAAS